MNKLQLLIFIPATIFINICFLLIYYKHGIFAVDIKFTLSFIIMNIVLAMVIASRNKQHIFKTKWLYIFACFLLLFIINLILGIEFYQEGFDYQEHTSQRSTFSKLYLTSFNLFGIYGPIGIHVCAAILIAYFSYKVYKKRHFAGLPHNVVQAIYNNNKIQAIWLLQKEYDFDLKEAKYYIENYIAQNESSILRYNKYNNGVTLAIIIAIVIVYYAIKFLPYL